MYFHKPSQQAFVFPPKCGTQTAMHFLKNCGWRDLGANHSTPEFFIEHYPNLLNYKIYAFFRNPLKRFESAILFAKQNNSYQRRIENLISDCGIQKNKETISYDELLDIFPKVKKNLGMIFNPQSSWYLVKNGIPLDFDNYEAEIRRISRNYTIPLVVKNKSTDFGRSVVTQKVIDFVRQEYAADYALAKDRLGKEY